MRTSKKLLSLFLSLVMIITSCSVGLTAFAADGNKTDSNMNYWNDATKADDAFEAVNNLVSSLLQIDAVKKALQDNNIVNPVTSSTTLSDVVEGASPLLISSLVQDVSKEDFLKEKYPDEYENNKEAFDGAFSSVDDPDAKDGDWSFYKLYKFCETYKDTSDDDDLKKYCTDTYAKLDEIKNNCYAKINTADASNTKINDLYKYAFEHGVSDKVTPTLLTISAVTYNGTRYDSKSDSDIKKLLNGKTYYFDFYKNIFNEIGLGNEFNSVADLIFYHEVPQGKIILNTYIYMYLMDKSGKPLSKDKFQTVENVPATNKITKLTFDNNGGILTDNGEINLAGLKELYPYSGSSAETFNKEYTTTATLQTRNRTDLPFIYSGRSANQAYYDSYWAYAVFDKYFMNGEAKSYSKNVVPAFNLNSESNDSKYEQAFGDDIYNDLLTGLNNVIEAKNEKITDEANKIKTQESGARIAEAFETEVANRSNKDGKTTYKYKDYKYKDKLKVNIANAVLNATIIPVLNTAVGDNTVQDIISQILGGDIDVVDMVKNIWLRLYRDPAVTIFNLLPLIMVVVDTVYPVIFHDDIDDQGFLANYLSALRPGYTVEDLVFVKDNSIGNAINGLLHKYIVPALYTQEEGDTEYGIGALHIDLNTALPAILHWMTGDKNGAYKIVGRYQDVTLYKAKRDENNRFATDENGNIIREDKPTVAHYDNNIPRFTNIYYFDKVLYNLDSQQIVNSIADLLKNTGLKNQGVYEIAQELLVFARDAVDDYLKEVNWTKENGASDKKIISNIAKEGEYTEACDGLNNIPVALPEVLNCMGQKFIKKYNISSDWKYTYEGKFDTRTKGSFKEKFNVRYDEFLGFSKEKSNKATAVKVLTSVVDLIIGNNLNALIDLLNDTVKDSSNKITTEVPIVYGLFAALGDFDETSVITDALNGLFQLKRSDDASFTLEKRTKANTIDGESKTNFVGFSITSGFYLISNILFNKGGEERGLIPFITRIVDASKQENKNVNYNKANYNVYNALNGTAPLLLSSKGVKKNSVSAAGTDYSKLLTKENLNAAKKLVNVLDELLASLLSNTSLNGFDLDATDNLLTGIVTTFAAYFGAKNTNDLLKLVNNYLFFVTGETSKKSARRGKIGTSPTSSGDVDANKVYTSANLSNLVIQTYSLLENIIDYLFYNSDTGLLSKSDPNMLVADALYGIVSPDAVAVRLSGKYSSTAKILKKDDYHNWNSFKVQITEIDRQKQSYNTKDFLKFGFKKGDKKAFYNALGESFNGIGAILGAALTTTIAQKGTQKNLYSEALYPVLNILSKSVKANGKVLSPAEYNKLFSSKNYGPLLVDGLIMPVGNILNEIYDQPMTFILNLVKGLGGILRDSQIKQILNGITGTVDLHVNGIANLLDKNVSNLSPTYAKSLRTTLTNLIKSKLDLSVPNSNIAVTLLNKLLKGKLPFTLPNIDFNKLYNSKSPEETLLLVYGYVGDTLLGMDFITTLVNSFDPSIANILKGLNAAQLLTVIVKALDVFKSPTEVYWSFAEYSKKIKNSFSYPKSITAGEATQDVAKLDDLVKNIFPLLNSLGVTDITGLDVVVRDNLYTNENITAIAKAIYGGLAGNSSINSVLEAFDLDLSPKGVAKYLTDKSYGKTYSSAAKTLKKAKSWKSVKKINWGFTNKTKGAQTGFINGLAASLRPFNKVLSVFLCEGRLDLLKKVDVKALVKTLSTKGTTEILTDKGENAATLNYKLKKGKFVLTIQSHNITGSNHRTIKSELIIDINGIVDDLNKTIKNVKLTMGTNGYENAVIPLLEAFMCRDVKTYRQYKKDYKKAKDNLLLDILKPIAGLVDDITAAPFDTITKILPNVAYYIDSCGLSQSVANLLAPITAKNGLINVFKKNGLDLDKLITGILGKSLGDALADLIGTNNKINLKLSNLKSFNIQDAIIPLVSNLLKEKLGIKLPNFTWADIASHGTVRTVLSKAKNSKGKYTTLQVKANQGEVLIAVFRYLAETIIQNAKALKKMICSIDAIKKNSSLKAIIGSIFDNLGISTKDEIVEAIFYFFNGTSTDRFFDYRDFKYKKSTFEWGKLDEDFCRKLNPMLDGLISGLIEGGLAGLVGEKLYTDDLVAKAATGIYGAIENVKVGNDSLTSLLAQTDIDFSTSNVANLLVNTKYGQAYPAAASVIKSAGSWKNVKASNLKFGVKDRNSFLHALTAVLRPAFGVLDVLFNNASLNLFDIVSIPGSDGYTSTIVPLLEAFGVYNIKTQYQYREDIFLQYDNILLDVLNPLWDKVEDVLNAPLETVMDILPNLALFFANDGLTQVIDNLLAPVSAVLQAIKPIVNINDVLKAANLDVPKLLKDKVGINLTKFDLYDLQGTLSGVISADKVVPLINSILPKIKIGGSALNLEIPDIDWLELASCGDMVFNEASQAACYGSRMYVKSDQDITLITVLRYIVDTINYKGNYDAIVNLINGIEGMPASVANVVPQVLGMLKGETDDVILSLIDLLQTLGG